MDMLDRIKEQMLPFANLLGIEFVSGAVMAFADTLRATGTILNLPEGAATATIESKTSFIAPAPVGTEVIGEATPVHRGRRTMIWQSRVTTQEGRLVALVIQTQLIL
ncbi:MAG: PaaI family thioesterase [Stellaceae bacterium]